MESKSQHSHESSGEEDERPADCEEEIEDDDSEQPQRLCWVCSKKVGAGIHVSNEFYHTACFRCCKCKRFLDIAGFIQSRGKLYCSKHFERVQLGRGLKLKGASIPVPQNFSASDAPVVLCQECGREVQNGVCIAEDFYHFECIKCDTCKQRVLVKNYKVMDGKIYCRTDYPKMVKSFAALKLESPHPGDETKRRSHKSSEIRWRVPCVVCDMPMVQGVYVQNAYYHVHCFRCVRCRVHLRFDRYEILDGKAYCLRDYGRVLAKQTVLGDKPEDAESAQAEPQDLLQDVDQCGVCHQCNSAVKVGWYIKGGHYHAPCLRCAICQDALLLSECKELEGQFYCLPDYKKIAPRKHSKRPIKKGSSSKAKNSAEAEGLPQNINDEV